MKRSIWILVLMLGAIPALAQMPADDAPGEVAMIGMVGSFAVGDLAVRSATGIPSDPVARLRDFFVEANQPLSKSQERDLQVVVDEQLKFTQDHATGQSVPMTDEVRKMNRAYFERVVAVLTPGQQSVMKQYQSEQIKLRGGFEALKLVLQDARVPLTADQEKQVESIYNEVNRQGAQLVQGAEGSSTVKVNRLQREGLEKVGRILTPDQRKALINSASPKG